MGEVQQYIGYDNIVTIGNLSADSAQAGYPVTNLANQATNLKWKSDSLSAQYITISPLSVTPIDYIGIAGHNLGTTRSAIDIEVQEDGSDVWKSILDFPYYPTDNKPILRIAKGSESYGSLWNQDGSAFGCSWFQGLGEHTYATWDQNADSYTGGLYSDAASDVYTTINFSDPAADTYETYGNYASVRIKISPRDGKPQIGVLYIGKIMRMERGLYVGHTPINYGRNVSEVNGMSESGEFLGRIIKQTTYSSDVKISNITPVWYRNEFDKFVLACIDRPFFYAWRLNNYANEIGYCWFNGDVPVPENTGPRGMMSVSFRIGGQA